MKNLLLTLAIAITGLVLAPQAEAGHKHNCCGAKKAVNTNEVCRSYHTETYCKCGIEYQNVYATITYCTTFVDCCCNYTTKTWKTTKWVKNEKTGACCCSCR